MLDLLWMCVCVVVWDLFLMFWDLFLIYLDLFLCVLFECFLFV